MRRGCDNAGTDHCGYQGGANYERFFCGYTRHIESFSYLSTNIPAQRLSAYQCRSKSPFSKISMTNGGGQCSSGIDARSVKPGSRNNGSYFTQIGISS